MKQDYQVMLERVLEKIKANIRPELHEFPALYDIEQDESYSIDIRMSASKILWEFFAGKLAYFNQELTKHRDRYYKLSGQLGQDQEAERMAAILASLPEASQDLIIATAQAMVEKRR